MYLRLLNFRWPATGKHPRKFMRAGPIAVSAAASFAAAPASYVVAAHRSQPSAW